MRGARSNLVIVTSGNYFAKIILTPILTQYQQWIRGVVIVTGDYNGRVGLAAAWELLRRMTLPYFLYKVFVALLVKFCSLWSGPNNDGFAKTLQKMGIEYVSFRLINHKGAQSFVADAKPDILISVSCPQKINKDTLELAKQAAINVHSSLLPSYAGLAPYYWVLSRGESQTGVTVHYMAEKFDAGNIITRRKVPIQSGTSAFGLFEELAWTAGDALLEALEAVAQGQAGEKQRLDDRSYYSHPTLESYINLRRRGHFLFTLSDLRRFVARSIDQEGHKTVRPQLARRKARWPFCYSCFRRAPPRRVSRQPAPTRNSEAVKKPVPGRGVTASQLEAAAGPPDRTYE